jgi:threonine dehydrogenase-like Zn-dependent dehydrogenase
MDYDYDHRLFQVGARLIERGDLPVSSIVTHRAHYSEAPAIYEMLRSTPEQAGAVLLCWD